MKVDRGQIQRLQAADRLHQLLRLTVVAVVVEQRREVGHRRRVLPLGRVVERGVGSGHLTELPGGDAEEVLDDSAPGLTSAAFERTSFARW